ncbi:MAG: SurA N-terminal domain-containing protein [Spirochaetes bacterium]|jgi:hypothetical protein|nr:SurA N-terminal domain-containing protein [Spirochaetota bacterium]
MVKSKNIFVKVFSYILVGILTVLLVISLGGTSFMDKAALDQTTIAVVNGEKVSIYDFNHFINTDQRFYNRIDDINSDEQMRNYVRSVYIQRVLTIQYAEKIGIVVVGDQVLNYIRSLSNLSDDDGKFSTERLNQLLKYYNISYTQFFKRTKDILILRELDHLIVNGTGVSPDEIRMEKSARGSKITLRYAFLSNSELKKRYPERLAVSVSEIEAEVKNIQESMSDPLDDSESLQKQSRISLESRKLAELKAELLSQINKLALENRPFSDGVALLDVTVGESQPFQIGNPVYSTDEKTGLLLDLYTNNVFYEDSLKVKEGLLARGVDVSNGLYIFTPKEKIISFDKDAEITQYDSYQTHQARSAFVENAMLSPFFEKSRVVRNY